MSKKKGLGMTCLLVYYHSFHPSLSCFRITKVIHVLFSILPFLLFFSSLFRSSFSLPFCLHPFPFVPRRRKIYVSSPFSDDFSRETLFASLSLSLSFSTFMFTKYSFWIELEGRLKSEKRRGI